MAAILGSASWTRFSPKSRTPAAKASRTASGGCVLLTATRSDVAGGPRGAFRRPGDALPDGGHAVGDHFLRALISPWAVATFWASVGLMLRYFSRYWIASGILPWPTISAPRR